MKQPPIDFSRVRWLSFDCYGTLIDWESGILAAVRPVLARHGAAPGDDQILAEYARLEAAEESDRYRPYRVVLRRVMAGLGAAFGAGLAEAECEALPRSLRDWPAFGDTVPSLVSLQRRFRLAVLSNIDDELFAMTAPRLGVKLDALVTAQECRSYKPAAGNFRALLERTRAQTGGLVHVAQSLYHDVAPARALGLKTVWVNRRGGHRATLPAEVQPDLEVPDLATLAAMLG
jgi:2-haloacid dehalogenase